MGQEGDGVDFCLLCVDQCLYHLWNLSSLVMKEAEDGESPSLLSLSAPHKSYSGLSGLHLAFLPSPGILARP